MKLKFALLPIFAISLLLVISVSAVPGPEDPDLIIESITFAPANPTINSEVIVTVTTKNTGGSATPTPSTTLLTLPGGGEFFITVPLGLAPQTSHSNSTTFTCVTAGNYAFKAEANKYGTFEEFHIDNNNKTEVLTCDPNLPDLSITRITKSSSSPIDGELFSVNVDTTNVGHIPSAASVTGLTYGWEPNEMTLNGDFNLTGGPSGGFLNWEVGDGREQSHTIQTAGCHSGNGCIRASWGNWWAKQNVMLESNKEYTLKVWVKNDGSASPSWTAFALLETVNRYKPNEGGSYIGYLRTYTDACENGALENGWQERICTFNPMEILESRGPPFNDPVLNPADPRMNANIYLLIDSSCPGAAGPTTGNYCNTASPTPTCTVSGATCTTDNDCGDACILGTCSRTGVSCSSANDCGANACMQVYHYIDDISLTATSVDYTHESKNFNVGTLAVQATQTDTANFFCPDVGTLSFTATADKNNVVNEISNQNNVDNMVVSCQPGPDLAIDSITFDPPSAKIGEQVTITVHTKNYGDGSAGTSMTGLAATVGSPVPTSGSVGSLAAGAGPVSQSFSYTCSNVGTVDFTATADVNSVITETNENNNIYPEQFSCLTNEPDYIISSISFSDNTPVVEDTVTVTVNTKNIGASTTSQSFTGIRGDAGADFNVTPLGENEINVITFDFTCLTGGAKTIRAEADIYTQITEADETNNILERTLNCGSAPDLIVESVRFTKTNPYAGEAITVNIRIRNAGTGPSAVSSPTKILKPNGGTLFMNVNPLTAGNSQTLTIPWTCPSQGSHTFTVTADDGNPNAESDETNNIGQGTVNCGAAGPDLVVSVIANQNSGSSFGTVTVRTKNIGPQTALESQTELVGKNSFSIPSLSPGQVYTNTYGYKCARNQQLRFTAIADSYDQVSEMSETNNRATSLNVCNQFSPGDSGTPVAFFQYVVDDFATPGSPVNLLGLSGVVLVAIIIVGGLFYTGRRNKGTRSKDLVIGS
ncbi:MAG: CARDB domain-containing protein [Candidatus Aenigmatarchaeota archaeon]